MFPVSSYFSLSSMGSSCSQCTTEVLVFQARNAVVLNPESRDILLLAGLCFEPEVGLDDFLSSVAAQITP